MSGSPTERLLEALSDLAGKNQALVDRLHRHAELCMYPAMKAALDRLAATEAEHVKTLGAILAQHRRWPKLTELPARNGANNWERLTGDLAILSEISNHLARQAIHWEALDPDIAQLLQAIVDEDSHVLGELRKLALRADPQALD
jgi:rubrerythrin